MTETYEELEKNFFEIQHNPEADILRIRYGLHELSRFQKSISLRMPNVPVELKTAVYDELYSAFVRMEMQYLHFNKERVLQKQLEIKNHTAILLNRLLEMRPLSPIEENDEWVDISHVIEEGSWFQGMSYAKRYPSLTKLTRKDGLVLYSDSERVICYRDDEPEETFHVPAITFFMDEFYPITFPYEVERPVQVYTKVVAEEGKTSALIGNGPMIYLDRMVVIDGELVHQTMIDKFLRFGNPVAPRGYEILDPSEVA